MSGAPTRRKLLSQAAALGAALAFGQSCAHTGASPRTSDAISIPKALPPAIPHPIA